MIISKINYVSNYSNKFRTSNAIQLNQFQARTNLQSRQNLSFGTYGHYDEFEARGGDPSQYEQYRILYGSGYGHTEYSQEQFQRDWFANHQTRSSLSSIDPALQYRREHSANASQLIREREYLEALKEKLLVAGNCRMNGEPSNTFLLEESVRGLYTKLSPREKIEARNVIREYNPDMATYIDQDIAKDPSRYTGMF